MICFTNKTYFMMDTQVTSFEKNVKSVQHK